MLATITSSIFAQTRIIMQKEGGVYTVPCKVNGLPLKFIFDTGASNVTISLTEAVFMIKNGYLDKNDIYGSSYSQLANGEITENTEILLKEIEIKGLKLYNVRASIVHELNAPLLLGQSAIEKLGKIQLNGNELIVMSNGRNHYDYSNNIQSNTTRSKYDSSTFFADIYPYNHTFSGIQSVYTYAPIIDRPNMINAKQIGSAVNNTVTILKKINNGYYKVKTGNITGFIWAGWFKN